MYFGIINWTNGRNAKNTNYSESIFYSHNTFNIKIIIPSSNDKFNKKKWSSSMIVT